MNKIYTGDNLLVAMNRKTNSVDFAFVAPPSIYSERFKNAIDVDSVVYGLCGDYVDVALDILHSKSRSGSYMRTWKVYIAQILIETKRILKPKGSICLHVPKHTVEYIKLVMKVVFGDSFLEVIEWEYSDGGCDTILRYFLDTEAKMTVLKDSEDWCTQMNQIPNWSSEDMVKPEKPYKLLRHILKASVKKGDVVLDLFCTNGKLLVTAQNQGLSWIAIRSNETALSAIEKPLTFNAINYKPREHIDAKRFFAHTAHMFGDRITKYHSFLVSAKKGSLHIPMDELNKVKQTLFLDHVSSIKAIKWRKNKCYAVVSKGMVTQHNTMRLAGDAKYGKHKLDGNAKIVPRWCAEAV